MFLSHALTDVAAMVEREIRRTLRSVDALISSLMIPVAILLVFVIVFGGAIERSGDYINYVVPGILILCTGFGSAGTAVAVAQDMKSGTINRFKTLPIFGPSVLIGHVVASVLRNLLASSLVLLVAVALGFRSGAGFGNWLLAVGLLMLVILSFTWLACLAGLLLSVDAANSINFVFLFLPYISSGFVETSTMPGWLQGFAKHQPFTPIIETLRALMTNTPVGNNGLQAVLWLGAILVIGYLGATAVYRRQ
jgi:ABC-2 type transport system permease protein